MTSTPFGEIIRAMFRMNPSKEKVVYSLGMLFKAIIFFTLIIIVYSIATIKNIITEKTMIPEPLEKVVNFLIDMRLFVIEFFFLFLILLMAYIFRKRSIYNFFRIVALKFPIWLYLLAGILLASHPFFKINLPQTFTALEVAFSSIFLTFLFVLFFPRDIDKPFWD